MIQVYKILKKIYMEDEIKLFIIAEYIATRGDPCKIYNQRYRLNFRENLFSNRAMDMLKMF